MSEIAVRTIKENKVSLRYKPGYELDLHIDGTDVYLVASKEDAPDCWDLQISHAQWENLVDAAAALIAEAKGETV